jgi:hypothetical protein
MDKNIPNFQNLTNEDGKVYGKYGTVNSVNPYNCHFVATYPDGRIIRGNNLFETGWDDIPSGLSKLEYILSTGHVIEIPKFKAYMPLIEVSLGMDGSRIFHSISVKCLAEKEILIYRIILKEDHISKLKIGDVVIGKEPIPEKFAASWRHTSN